MPLTDRYASLDYEDAGYEKSDIVKLQLLVNKEPVDAISQVMHRSQCSRMGRQWVTKFKEFVQRQLFEVVIQAAVGKNIVARETIKAVRKDVTAKLYGGDRTRRMKLLEKQKEGRKKLQGE
jgi:translation elongation factor EF-4